MMVAALRNRFRETTLAVVGALALLTADVFGQSRRDPILEYSWETGLIYHADVNGNRVPDFSTAGYLGGDSPIPEVEVKVTVAPGEGDSTARIQAAINYVATLPFDAKGQRGAVYLEPGEFSIAGQLELDASGVVLRGAGPGEGGTRLVATGRDRRTLIRIIGKSDRVLDEARARDVTQNYVRVNAHSLELSSTEGWSVGERVLVRWPSTEAWLESLEMDRTDYKGHLDWRPGYYDITFDRTITAIDGHTITLDAPLTMVMDRALGQAIVTPYTWPGRISQVGVEQLELVSDYDRSHPMDEEHAWMGVVMENVENAWVRAVNGRHFVSSLVSIWENCRAITVADCKSFEPVSELAGYRRHTFYTAGSQTLFLRCWSEEGIHDFATGWLAAGPNAFVDCDTRLSHDFSGPIESWATGVLFDGCDIDRGGLMLLNRDRDYAGVGWAAGNSLLYNSTAAKIGVYDPPSDDRNWAIGCWGLFYGRGWFQTQNSFVDPESLYFEQLAERTTRKHAAVMAEPTSKPGVVEFSDNLTVELLAADQLEALLNPPAPPSHPLVVQNGWLTIDGKLVVGEKTGVRWWRGHVQPNLNKRSFSYGIGVTRFVPGREGRGFTDDLDELTDDMIEAGQVALEHNMGLWYDRRRDDHQMVRRADAQVWPPFYEMPWARSGVGTNWMGLSRYDLSQFNPWYFRRLREFADLGEEKGLVLLNQHYFQHNILEAGAHWADYAWRSANNINDVGFPEPPPYEDRKRIFMSELFYDVEHPVRRPLHEAFIRQHLERLAGASNVIHLIGAEYTGPEAFARLWVETIRDWQAENGDRQHVAISTTKDVQDAILADPELAPTIDILNLVSWHFVPGGEALAPRQHRRAGNGRGVDALLPQIREYRALYPEKAVMGDFGRRDGWSVILAGGSLAAIAPLENDAILSVIPTMRPWEPAGGFGQENVQALALPGSEYLLRIPSGEPLTLDLREVPRRFRVQWINPASGEVDSMRTTITGGQQVQLQPIKSGFSLVWLSRES
jgi:hypothetical protein